MKTTIEISGFEIHIEQDGDIVEIEVLRGGEVVDELKLDASDFSEEAQGKEGQGEDHEEGGVKSFADFGGSEEEDFGDEGQGEEEEEEEEMGGSDDIENIEGGEHDAQEEEEEKETEHKLESFQAFINKSKKK